MTTKIQKQKLYKVTDELLPQKLLLEYSNINYIKDSGDFTFVVKLNSQLITSVAQGSLEKKFKNKELKK